MMIDEKFARLRTYLTILAATVGCLKPSFQTSSANSSKGALKKIRQQCKYWLRRPFQSRSNSLNRPPSFRLRLEDGWPPAADHHLVRLRHIGDDKNLMPAFCSPNRKCASRLGPSNFAITSVAP